MVERPIPLADEVTAPYWTAIRAHELHVQRCGSCDAWIHEPQAFCPACTSTSLSFRRVRGTGSIYSFTTLVDAPAPGFVDRLPLTIVIVELDESPRLFLTGNLVDAPDDVTIGTRVRAVFEDIVDPETDEAVTLAQFQLEE